MSPTTKLRLLHRLEKTGVVESGPLEGNYIWTHAEKPTLQQWFEEEEDDHVYLPAGEWRDIEEHYEER